MPSGTAIRVARPVVRMVPTIAGPMPGPDRRTGGMSSVNQPAVVTASQPFWTTVTRTKPRGIRTITKARPIKTVASKLRTERPDRFGVRSAGGSCGGALRVVVIRLVSS